MFADWVGGFTPTHIELLKSEIGLLDALNLTLLKKKLSFSWNKFYGTRHSLAVDLLSEQPILTLKNNEFLPCPLTGLLNLGLVWIFRAPVLFLKYFMKLIHYQALCYIKLILYFMNTYC